jgi:hypothetical protein
MTAMLRRKYKFYSDSFFSIKFPKSTIATVVLLLCMVHSATASQSNANQQINTTQQPGADQNVSPLAGVDVPTVFQGAVARLVSEKRFDLLEQIAGALRSGKDRWPGGRWKLQAFYGGVASPAPGSHATEEDWAGHLQRVNEWVAAKPKSITARVALAESYLAYAWDARGTGFADSVTDSGWKLFEQRIAKAEQVLQQASALEEKCPHWYRAMQQVALAQGWEPERANALFEQAIAFEPGYFPVYRAQAQFLLPKWNGEKGDLERFAELVANRAGGSKGDIIYFEIAAEIACGCEEDDPLKRLSWKRIQQGFAAAEKEYGVSYIKLNQIARMAVDVRDGVHADEFFKRIGDNWDSGVWRKKASFDSDKTWAAQVAPGQAWLDKADAEAEANLHSVEGQQYKKDLDKALTALVNECATTGTSNAEPFQLRIRMGKEGTPQATVFSLSTPVTDCLLKSMYGKKFPLPPQTSYWVVLDLHPKPAVIGSAK